MISVFFIVKPFECLLSLQNVFRVFLLICKDTEESARSDTVNDLSQNKNQKTKKDSVGSVLKLCAILE